MSAVDTLAPVDVRRLCVAIMDEAIACIDGRALCGGNGRAGSVARRRAAARAEALDWIRSTDRSHPFAFENVCDVLGDDFEPQAVRERLLRRKPELRVIRGGKRERGAA